MTVLDIGVSPPSFRISWNSTSSVVFPGQTVRAAFAFSASEALDDEVDGTVTIVTDNGCARVRVLGVAGDGSVNTVSEAAIDFGMLASGTSSIRSVDVQYQAAPNASPPSDYSQFKASPAQVFTVVDAPSSPFRPDSCQPFRVVVEFTAPLVSGKVEGALNWFVTTETAEGTAEAFVHIPLFGQVE